jgi:hypothetical protein
MTGKLYIDGRDAFTDFGVFVEAGGYAGLVEWPALKAIDANDWPEDDGIDADLSEPKLESKEFEMSFCCVDYEKTTTLFQRLTDGAYHTFEFVELGITKQLRLVAQPGTRTIAPLQVFSLRFADDDYLKGYVRSEPSALPAVGVQNCEIDDVDLSEYGVRVLAGTLDALLKAPAVKQNLKIDTALNNGAIYEDTEVRFQQKDVTFKFSLNTPDVATFCNNYRALLFDLTQPTERMLQLPAGNEYFSFYYKSSSVSRFAKAGNGIWCEFDVTLCFVSARPGQIEYLLSTEDDRLLMTEDSTEDYNQFIDMS